MKYQLSTRFQKEVQSIVDYIIDNFGKQYAIDFAEGLQKELILIAKYPESAAREPLLMDKQTEFRAKCVSKHNKAIYYVKGDTVYFTDMWDMRRNPDRLVKRIKKK